MTSVAFCPTDDCTFVSGCIDQYIRLWSIPHMRVSHFANVHDIVSAVTFASPTSVVVGLFTGWCRLYRLRGQELEYHMQFECRQKNNKGKGRKVTGIECEPGQPDHLLVSTNDSRIRLYDEYSLQAKYKGHKN